MPLISSLLLKRLLDEPEVRGHLTDAHVPESVPGSRDGVMVYGRWNGTPAIAKIGIPANELYWAREVARVDPGVMPTLFASGDTLGSESVAWHLMERCPTVLGWQFHDVGYRLLMEAGVRFQLATRRVRQVKQSDVDVGRIGIALRECLTCDYPVPEGSQRLAANLERDMEWVRSVCEVEMCHGDLHPSNAVLRVTPPDPAAQVLLVDISCWPTFWAHEGSYCEIIWWHAPIPDGHPTMTHAMAAVRARHGMSVPSDADLHRLSTLYRGWHALRAWPRASHRNHASGYEAAARQYIKEAAALSGTLA